MKTMKHKSLETEVQITPENCEAMTLILNMSDSVEREDYKFVETCVKVYICSRFDRRRKKALKELKRFFINPHVQIHRLDRGDTTWTYISLGTKKGFLFVNTYKTDVHHLEIFPIKKGLTY